jgi:hypothetical protein
MKQVLGATLKKSAKIINADSVLDVFKNLCSWGKLHETFPLPDDAILEYRPIAAFEW